MSEAAREAPPPRLGETAAFDAALARADPDARRLEAGSAELAARAAALRARAAALGGAGRRSGRPPAPRGRPAADGTNAAGFGIHLAQPLQTGGRKGTHTMNSIIYLVGLIVIVMAVLSLIGLA